MPGPQIKPGFGDFFKCQGALTAVFHLQAELPRQQAPGLRLELQRGGHATDAGSLAAGVLEAALHPLVQEAGPGELQVVVVKGVLAAVVAGEQQRVPDRQGLGNMLLVVGLQIRRRHAHRGTHAPGLVPGGHPGLGADLDALAVDFQPATGAPGLVVADLVGGLAEAVQVAAVLALLDHAAGRGVEGQVEGNWLGGVGLEHHAHLLQGLDDLVADGPGIHALGVAVQGPAGAHHPLFRAPGDAGVGIHHVAVGVLAKAEADLQGAVDGRRHAADLFRPGQVALADAGEGLHDLVVELFVAGQERANTAGHARSPCRYQGRYQGFTRPVRAGKIPANITYVRLCRKPPRHVRPDSRRPSAACCGRPASWQPPAAMLR